MYSIHLIGMEGNTFANPFNHKLNMTRFSPTFCLNCEVTNGASVDAPVDNDALF